MYFHICLFFFINIPAIQQQGMMHTNCLVISLIHTTNDTIKKNMRKKKVITSIPEEQDAFMLLFLKCIIVVIV